jgi:hypothetical protein
MPRTLTPADGRGRNPAPSGATKLAQRMLNASRIVADIMPPGFHGSAALDILLAMHVAQADAQYLRAGELSPPGNWSPEITARWIAALVQKDLVEQHGDMLALTTSGYALVSRLLEAIHDGQRALD